MSLDYCKNGQKMDNLFKIFRGLRPLALVAPTKGQPQDPVGGCAPQTP